MIFVFKVDKRAILVHFLFLITRYFLKITLGLNEPQKVLFR
ncbi:hypothetical protein PESP_a0363 [Pseudoalteromonas espejiana DSM 9414]|nr:hypothetical protein PESP_a0363 [Pseudoalteromonas espejiana DSM 9414]